MSDAVNTLMDRCEAARQRAQATETWTIEDFRVSADHWDDAWVWYVGFYTSAGGKHNAEGATLTAALEKWLADYEHWWDNRSSSETT